MNTYSKIIFYSVIFFFSGTGMAYCQSFSIDDGTRSELFLYEVKGIDEFIERFDADTNTLICKTFKKRHHDTTLTRRQLLLSLFDFSQNWANDSTLLRNFFKQMLDFPNGNLINFTDTNWYSEASCVFSNRHKQVVIPVYLHLKKGTEGGYQWMICGVGDNMSLDSAVNYPAVKIKQDTSFQFIQPSGYATNFIELFNVFTESVEPKYFFEPEMLKSPKGANFVNLILHNKIKLQEIKSVKFHFFKVDNWVFAVNHFERNSLNSGWLISDLRQVNNMEKTKILNRMLNH